MGFAQEEVMKALEGQKYNEATAVYLLLGRKPAEVSPVSRRSPEGHLKVTALFSLASRQEETASLAPPSAVTPPSLKAVRLCPAAAWF